ncbi:MAG: mechanosensitive ion channel [Candidatus Delongbacteria bacterium]|nr:mechanosensitive ion channel [Candidatus Delongbacteria bacterium]
MTNWIDYLNTIMKLIGIPALLLIGLHLGYRMIRRYAIISSHRIIINFIFMLAASLFFFSQLDFDYQFAVIRVHYFILGLSLAFIGIKLIEALLIKRIFSKRSKVQIPLFVRDILYFIILIAVAVILLEMIFGVKPSTFIVTSTVLSAVIGLAMQDMLANVIAGIALQVEQPFRVGDWVKINDREGAIVEMSWRSTKLKTRENDYIIIPNTMVGKQEIFNYYLPETLHAIRIYIKINYQTPPHRVKNSILRVVNTHSEILSTPPATVFAYQFTDYAIEYEVKCWINDYFMMTRIHDELQTLIWYQLKRDGIEIGVLYQELMIWKGKPESIQSSESYGSTTDEIMESFRHIRILNPFSRDQLQELARQVKCEWYGRGEYLVRQGEPGSSFYIIKSGQVEVLIEGANGELNSVGRFGSNYFFGERALLTGEPRNATIKAVDDTEAIVINKEEFGRMLIASPQMAEALSVILEQRQAELMMIKEDAALKQASRQKQSSQDSKTLLQKIQSFFNLSGF